MRFSKLPHIGEPYELALAEAIEMILARNHRGKKPTCAIVHSNNRPPRGNGRTADLVRDDADGVLR